MTYETCGDAWADIPYAEDWQRLGIDPVEDRAWDMDPMLAEPWIRMCFLAHEANEWLDRGFDEATAGEWNHAGLGQGEAEEAAYLEGLARNCLSQDGARAWVRAPGHPVDHIAIYLRAGVSLAEAPPDGPTPEIVFLAQLSAID